MLLEPTFEIAGPTGVGVRVTVGGAGVRVGGTSVGVRVAVGGRGVRVAVRVAVGGTGVSVGGTGVAEGVTGVAVGGAGVDVGPGSTNSCASAFVGSYHTGADQVKSLDTVRP